MKTYITNFVFGIIATIIYVVVASYEQVSELKKKGEKFSVKDRPTMFPKGYWNNYLFKNFLITFDFVLISFYIIECLTKKYLLIIVFLILIKAIISFQILYDNFNTPGKSDKLRVAVLSFSSLILSLCYIFIEKMWLLLKYLGSLIT